MQLTWRETLLAALALMFVGCAETQRLMARYPEAEAFVTRAATAYGQQPPSMHVSATGNGWVAYVQDGVIHLDMDTLGFADWRLKKVLAHEYAHILLNNFRNGGTPALENETDAKGVEVLMKADNLSEREAFDIFYRYAGGWRVLKGELPVVRDAKGHGSLCERIDYLLVRYPVQATWAKPCGYKPATAEVQP